MIDIWYGDEQRFGHLGIPQRWINILGCVNAEHIASLHYRLDGSAPKPLCIGPDGHRLAMPGDFNVELAFGALEPGKHLLTLVAQEHKRTCVQRDVELVIERQNRWPLPCHIEWRSASSIQEVAQVVDGHWKLTANGVRVVDPYYDRVIAFGDLGWTDYEVRTTVTFHGLRVPFAEKGDAGANVIHAALATRWPGHDEDERQPHVKWFPLGATAEFRVNPSWQGCSWRILGGGSVVVEAAEEQSISLGKPYHMKHRVKSASDGTTHYRVKLWEAGLPEPKTWAVELCKPQNSVRQGGALLIAHYTDVSFGDVEVIAV